MNKVYLNAVTILAVVVILSLGLMLACGSSDDLTDKWNDLTEDQLLDKACDTIMGCGGFPDKDTCKSALGEMNYENCELACFAAAACDQMDDCHDASSELLSSYCDTEKEDGDNTEDGDQTTNTDGDSTMTADELFSGCDDDDNECAQHYCEYKDTYTGCVEAGNQGCEDILLCIDNYKTCVCPDGSYAEENDANCSMTVLSCIAAYVDADGDTDTDTSGLSDFNPDDCKTTNIQFIASECGLAVCGIAAEYQGCNESSGYCDDVYDCLNTYWKCTCPDGVYQGGQIQYNCAQTYYECTDEYNLD